MKKTLLISVLSLLAITACKQQPANNTPTTIDSTKVETTVSDAATTETPAKIDCSEFEKYDDLLANEEPEKTKENAKYVQLSEKIWNRRMLSSDVEKDLPWVQCCQMSLTEAFNETQPKAPNLSDPQKADSMASIIYAFLTDKKEDLSTFGMVHSEEVCGAFTRYKMVSTYNELLKKDPASRAEIQAWENVEDKICKFMCDAVILENFGGSIVRVNLACTQTALYAIRLKDVTNQLNGKTTSSANVSAAKDELIKAIEKRFHTFDSYEAETQEEKDYLEDMKYDKEETIKALDAWLKVRADKQMDAYTVEILNGLKKMNASE